MKYIVRQPQSEKILGPFSLAEISQELASGSIADDFEAHDACDASGQGFTISDLRGSGAWVPVSQLSESAAQSERPPEGSGAMTRYGKAYIVAGAVSATGVAVKAIGVILGVLAMGAGLLVGIQNEGSSHYMLGGVLLGAIVAIPIFVLGVLVCAQAEVLKATLDTAVHSSPFLTKEDMAKVMLL
jgi:hypothetical protein